MILKAAKKNKVMERSSSGLGKYITWSKDGSKIAFYSEGVLFQQEYDDWGIYAVDLKNKNIELLLDYFGIQDTLNGESVLIDSDTLQLSPDWNKILFVGRIDYDGKFNVDRELFTVDVDGTNLVRLTHNEGIERDASWSPDGSKIVWVSEVCSPGCQESTMEIYVMNSDGTGVIRVTKTPEISEWDPHLIP